MVATGDDYALTQSDIRDRSQQEYSETLFDAFSCSLSAFWFNVEYYFKDVLEGMPHLK